MSALLVAIVKSSVPRGEQTSSTVFDAVMITASTIHGGGSEWASTTQRQSASDPAKPLMVPSTDLRLTSPTTHTRIVCLPNSDPPISLEREKGPAGDHGVEQIVLREAGDEGRRRIPGLIRIQAVVKHSATTAKD